LHQKSGSSPKSSLRRRVGSKITHESSQGHSGIASTSSPSTIEDTAFKPYPLEQSHLQQEHAALIERMSTLTDDVKVAEHKILEVGKLQSILAETLALQADVIDTIHDDVEEASSNVEAGNREMQEVIRTNIDFYLGVFMLFVFLSCCLLFLDWYRS
jgi:hypothetical protein